MVFNPARPELATVTSEALQAKIRDLLPSQDGFGADLAAQNVIVPIIDLTAAAAGTDSPQYLQTALNFGGATVFNGAANVANTPGFYRIVGTASVTSASGAKTAHISITDGATTKIVWSLDTAASSGTVGLTSESFDLTIFLVAGETCAVANDSLCRISGSIRQVATVTGQLVNPVGFSPE
tara:strand:- start:577 stop:1119 length:543 start_codon:yes stop_codon:yes gene_type:complete